ncbi:MAG TPA: hypothetical protein VNF06_01125 [Candidatus Aquilonibacter sp.]|nr:hypothetical protein [Candidatus Aquilonibacter sp.]
MGSKNALQVYRGAPASPQLYELISSQRKLEDLAKKLVSKSELRTGNNGKLYVGNEEVNLKSRGEANLFRALEELRIKIAYETVCFFMPGLRDGFKPDFFTNIYVHDGKTERWKHKTVNGYKNDRIVLTEMHSMDWFEQNKNSRAALNQGRFYLNKVSTIRTRYPEIYFIFISNVRQEKLEAMFNTETKNICDEYYFMPNAYEKQRELLDMFRSLTERKNVRVEGKSKAWHKTLIKIASKELERVRDTVHSLWY